MKSFRCQLTIGPSLNEIESILGLGKPRRRSMKLPDSYEEKELHNKKLSDRDDRDPNIFLLIIAFPVTWDALQVPGDSPVTNVD